MKILMGILVALLGFGLLAACTPGLLRSILGSGNVVRENRDVSNFDRVVLGASGDLEIVQGETEALVIEAEDNILPLIESEVRNGTLRLEIRPNSGTVNPRRTIRYFLTVRALNSIALAGSGNIRAETLTGDELSLTLSGSGELAIGELAANALNLEISGSGDVEAGGAVTRQRVRLSGSGTYRAGDLASQIAQVEIPGSGEVTVWATESLEISISGSGTVAYHGNPQINQRISGSGNVRSLGRK